MIDHKPLVTVACITYNHEPYIKTCLDSILMQQTEFDFEIVVHDDASTDKTQDILKQYQSNYPQKIKLILRTENTYSLGATKIFYNNIIKNTTSKYIALCEGDDYWLGDRKLQSQIQFLQENNEYYFSCGRIKVLNQATGNLIDKIESRAYWDIEVLTTKDYLKSFFSKTPSFVFRRQGFDMPDFCNRFYGEDILFAVLGSRLGKIKYHKEFLAVYRDHAGGVTKQKVDPRMQYLDIYTYIEALFLIVDKKYKWVFQSLKLKIYLRYKVLSSNSKIIKPVWSALSSINEKVRLWL